MMPDNKNPKVNSVLQKTFVRANLNCTSTMEVPFYSSNVFADVCFQCGESVPQATPQSDKDAYPTCVSCHTSAPKRKRNIWQEAQAKKNK